MEAARDRPPRYQHHDPDTLKFPPVPQGQLSPPPSAPLETLPSLQSLNLLNATDAKSQQPSGPPPVLKNTHSHPQWLPNFPKVPTGLPRPPTDVASPMESVMSYGEESHMASSVISLEDPDVRMAAEALSGMGNPEFTRSPPNQSSRLPSQPPLGGHITNTISTTREQEPILTLLTAQHPWIGGTINGSLTAYNSTKHYSPHFVRNSAEFVERNFGNPVAYTVAEVSRRTGVEGRVRRYLGDRSPSPTTQDGHKRRKVMSNSPDHMDIEQGLANPRSRAASSGSQVESLPPYDSNRSPEYEEQQNASAGSQAERSPSARQRNWPTQMMITTSGLGVALKDGSLQCLKYCLEILRRGAHHITYVMRNLQRVLAEYERTSAQQQQNGVKTESGSQPTDQERARKNNFARAIRDLWNDIWATLRHVVNAVSNSAGSALPDNAGAFVRRQLMSIPQRWTAASRSPAGGEHTVQAANKMLAFAQETLDMLAQVTMVIEGTIVSAEAWLESLGRRQNQEQTEGRNDSKLTLVTNENKDTPQRDEKMPDA